MDDERLKNLAVNFYCGRGTKIIKRFDGDIWNILIVHWDIVEFFFTGNLNSWGFCIHITVHLWIYWENLVYMHTSTKPRILKSYGGWTWKFSKWGLPWLKSLRICLCAFLIPWGKLVRNLCWLHIRACIFGRILDRNSNCMRILNCLWKISELQSSKCITGGSRMSKNSINLNSPHLNQSLSYLKNNHKKLYFDLFFFTLTMCLCVINLIVILTKKSRILPEVNVKNNYFEWYRF